MPNLADGLYPRAVHALLVPAHAHTPSTEVQDSTVKHLKCFWCRSELDLDTSFNDRYCTIECYTWHTSTPRADRPRNIRTCITCDIRFNADNSYFRDYCSDPCYCVANCRFNCAGCDKQTYLVGLFEVGGALYCGSCFIDALVQPYPDLADMGTVLDEASL